MIKITLTKPIILLGESFTELNIDEDKLDWGTYNTASQQRRDYNGETMGWRPPTPQEMVLTLVAKCLAVPEKELGKMARKDLKKIINEVYPIFLDLEAD